MNRIYSQAEHTVSCLYIPAGTRKLQAPTGYEYYDYGQALRGWLTIDHPASSYGLPVLLDRYGRLLDLADAETVLLAWQEPLYDAAARAGWPMSNGPLGERGTAGEGGHPRYHNEPAEFAVLHRSLELELPGGEVYPVPLWQATGIKLVFPTAHAAKRGAIIEA